MPRFRKLILLLVLLACIIVSRTGMICAQEAQYFRHGFDSQQKSWGVIFKKYKTKIHSHRINQQIFHQGTSSESFELTAKEKETPIVLSHKLPHARTLDELIVSLWFRSNRPGMKISLRVNFPHQRNPKTGKHLAIFVSGDQYTEFGNWQQLKCSPTRKLINEQITLAMSRLKLKEVNRKNAYVDLVMLKSLVDTGTVEYFMDTLKFGPIVSPTMDSQILQASNEIKEEEEKNVIRIQNRLGRLILDGNPYFPRIIPYQGESPRVIRNSGCNVVLIPQYNDATLMQKLQRYQLEIMAIPPRLAIKDGEASKKVGLMPFTDETAPILFWYLGTRIPPKDRKILVDWSHQIRNADYRFRRPLVADVVADQRIFSRRIDMQGTSKHILNTNISLRQYRDDLLINRRRSTHGSFTWTWIQTEPSPANSTLLERTRRTPVVIEPEQIHLQVYAALAAGCRGIGYWSVTPLDSNAPGALERRLMIAQTNMELELLQPFLATGRVTGNIPFYVKTKKTEVNQRNVDLILQQQGRKERDRLLRMHAAELKESQALGSELQATVIRFDGGTLVLPVWYQDDAQFVPGRMVANDATILVKGIESTAAAWEITTTRIRSLNTERKAGGKRVILEKFDRTAIILFTSDRGIKNKLEARMKQMAARSARTYVDLAKEKLKRVRKVDQQLQDLSVGKKFAKGMLNDSADLLEQAEVEFKKGAYHRAHELALNALQIQRTLQYTYWSDAVRSLGSPMASPYTTSFQTLPEHWRLISKLGKSELSEQKNLIHSGTFEDIDTMIIEGWEHSQNNIEGIHAAAELFTHARKGKYCLRLVAKHKNEESYKRGVFGTPVKVVTPPVMVRHGEIIHARGWIKVVTPITGSVEGLIIHDNQGGPVTSLRWRKRSDWIPFTLIREAHFTGKYRLTIALKGVGEVLIDDLQLVSIQPNISAAGHEVPTVKEPSNSIYNRSLDLLNRIPRPRLPGRKPQPQQQPQLPSQN